MAVLVPLSESYVRSAPTEHLIQPFVDAAGWNAHIDVVGILSLGGELSGVVRAGHVELCAQVNRWRNCGCAAERKPRWI